MTQGDLFGKRPSRPPANPLEEFCGAVARQYRRGARISPEEVAALFVERFHILPPVTLRDQVRLARRLGIRHFGLVDMPEGLCGCNAKYADEYTIQVNRLHARVRQEHTIFHELYELICHRLQEIVPGVWATPDTQRERDADAFAAHVFMPEEGFLRDALECGLDVVDLCRCFRRAYSSILIHLVKSLRKMRIPVLALLYENRAYEPGHARPEPTSGSGTDVSFSRLCLRYRWATLGLSSRLNPILHSCLPRRGAGIVPGTLPWLTVAQRRSVYIERMAPFDFFGKEDLAVLARPVMWKGSGVAKVIIVGVRYDQRGLLDSQLAQLDHEVIPRATGFDVRVRPKPLWLPLPRDTARQQPVPRRAHAAVRSRP